MEGTGRVMFGADLHMSNGTLDYFMHLYGYIYLRCYYYIATRTPVIHFVFFWLDSNLLYLSIALASH